jgi:hypothetical protein
VYLKHVLRLCIVLGMVYQESLLLISCVAILIPDRDQMASELVSEYKMSKDLERVALATNPKTHEA